MESEGRRGGGVAAVFRILVSYPSRGPSSSSPPPARPWPTPAPYLSTAVLTLVATTASVPMAFRTVHWRE